MLEDPFEFHAYEPVDGQELPAWAEEHTRLTSNGPGLPVSVLREVKNGSGRGEIAGANGRGVTMRPGQEYELNGK